MDRWGIRLRLASKLFICNLSLKFFCSNALSRLRHSAGCVSGASAKKCHKQTESPQCTGRHALGQARALALTYWIKKFDIWARFGQDEALKMDPTPQQQYPPKTNSQSQIKVFENLNCLDHVIQVERCGVPMIKPTFLFGSGPWNLHQVKNDSASRAVHIYCVSTLRGPARQTTASQKVQ